MTLGRIRGNILYVDDDKQNLDVFYYAFRDLFTIYIASTIDEAWQFLNSKSIKILISDQRMPETKGLDFIHQVQSAYPDIVSVLLTAYSDTEIMMDAINRVGIYRFILKPWQEHEMVMTIQNALEKYDLQRERNSLIENLRLQNQKLEIAKLKAEESSRLKAAFLGNISHEIRTPMNAIIGFSELLLNENLSREQEVKYANLVNNSCKNLLTVLNDIILLSQLQAEAYTPIFEKTSLDQLRLIVQEMGNHFKNKYSKSALNFSVEVNSHQGVFNVFLESLIEIISKLVDNAYKYTEKGSINVKLDLATDGNINVLKLIVEDTGIGIAGSQFEHIFTSFYQPKPHAGEISSGNGIGLSIVKELISIIQGKIEVKSEPGAGARFECDIPIENLNNKNEDYVFSSRSGPDSQ